MKHWQVALLVVVLGGIAYSLTFQTPFMFDGLYHIANNPGIRDLWNLEAVFFSGYAETRPIFSLSMAVCYAIAKTDVWVYHLVNWLLHIGCALLLYVISNHLQQLWLTNHDDPAKTSTLSTQWPALSALLFVVHPLATESVTYINSRSVLLMTFFGLLSLRSFLIWSEGKGGWGRYGWSLFAFVLAIGSKESAAVLPFLFAFIVGLWLRKALPRKKLVIGLLPFFAGIGLIPLMFLWVTNPHPPNPYLEQYALLAHIMTSARIFGWFLLLSFVPFYHNFDYDFRWSSSIVDASFFATIAVWGALLWTGWKLRKRQPALLMGLLWFGFSLAPTNTIVLKDFMAERYLYSSLVGSSWILAWALIQLLQWKTVFSPKVVGAVTAIVILVFGGLTMARNEVLRTPLKLWKHTVQQSPNKARPHINAGIYLMGVKKFKQGHFHLQRALKLKPKDPYVHYNLGVFYEKSKQWDKSVAAYQEAFKLKRKKRYVRSLAKVHFLAGHDAATKKDWKTSEYHFKSALYHRPMYASANLSLGKVYLQQQKFELAIEQFKAVLMLHPNHRYVQRMVFGLEKLVKDRTKKPKGKKKPELR